MEAFQEAIAAAKEQSLILKGKRTKRQRPQSPIPFSMISPPMEEKSTDLDSSKENNVENRKKDGVIITSSSSSVSYNNPTLSSKEEDEDQDIANCLILLAQGHSLPQQHLKTPNNAYRFSSRKFLETSSSTNDGTTAKAGYYVYQCKTCDRTFPSFQALGGHRASHKKPKPTTSFYTNLDHQLKKNIYQNDTVSLITTTHNTNRSLFVHGKSSNNKVHECGICGAEFTSGQALGGHMRRHRGVMAVPVAMVAPTVANTELSLSPMSCDQVSDGQDQLMMMPVIKRAKKSVVSLDLDLNNLPATSEDENRFMSFVSKQKQEQEEMKQREEPKSLLVLSTTPTLVDCHY